MSIQAMVSAINHRVGDHSLKLLLLSIANYCDDEWKCWPKVERLAFDTECSKRTIQRSLVKLSELGLINVVERFDQYGRQLSSMIYLLIGEGANLSPRQVGGDKTKGGGCQKPGFRGDSKVSSLNEPLENRHIEPSIKDSCTIEEKFEELWAAKPARDGSNPKKPALEKFRKLCKAGKNPDRIIEACANWAAHLKARNKIGTEYVPMLATWLNQGRFETDGNLPSGPAPSGGPKSSYELTLDLERRMKANGHVNGSDDQQPLLGGF